MSETLQTHSTRVPLGEFELDTDGARVAEVGLLAAQVAAAVGVVPFQSSVFSITDGRTTDPEKHGVKEFWCILEGPCEVVLGEKVFGASTGELFVIAPGENHQLRSTSGNARVLSIWWS